MNTGITLTLGFVTHLRRLRAYLKENPGASCATHPDMPGFHGDTLERSEMTVLVGFAEAHDMPLHAFIY